MRTQMISQLQLLNNNQKQLIAEIDALETSQKSNKQIREQLIAQMEQYKKMAESNKEAFDIETHAIEILRELSDEVIKSAYEFLEENINSALDKMFKNTTRQIKLKEHIIRNQYPQLEIELMVGEGRKRSLKTDSGHGIAQIISLLSTLCVIVLTGSRRLLVLDEVMSGLSVHNRRIINDILWTFTEIGFQFIINEHGFIPEGSKVYHLEMVGDISRVKNTFICKTGVYLDNDIEYVRSSKSMEEIEEDFEMPMAQLDFTERESEDTSVTPESTINTGVISI